MASAAPTSTDSTQHTSFPCLAVEALGRAFNMTTDMFHHHPQANYPSRGLYADALHASSSAASPMSLSGSSSRRYEPTTASRSYADYPQSSLPSSSRCPWSPTLRSAHPPAPAVAHSGSGTSSSGVPAAYPDTSLGADLFPTSHKAQHTHAPAKRSASPQLPPAVSPASPPARKNPPPKHSTDALAKWFAELAW